MQKNLAQTNDTVIIKEVEIFDKQLKQSLENKSYQNLSQVLKKEDFVFIKDYGPGQLATTTIRGLGANHTSVLWEGLSINNSMLGMSDLSLLPTFLFTQTEKLEGNNLLLTSNGNFGGGFNLNSTAPQNFKLKVFTDYNFYRYANQGISIENKINKFFYRYSLFGITAKNKFSYYNPLKDSVITQTHANQKSLGQLIEVGYYFNKHITIEAKHWLQYAYRNLPSPIGVNNNTEYQTDFFNRTFIKLSGNFSKLKLSNTFGLLCDSLNYFNPKANASNKQSLSYTSTVRNVSSANYIVNKWLMLNTSYQLEHYKVNTINYNNYSTKITNQYLLINPMVYISNFKFSPLYKVAVYGLKNKYYSIYNFYLEYSYKKIFSVTGNYGNNYRFPTLNDLYWYPNGNINLQPENGKLSDIGLMISPFKKNNSFIKATIYQNFVTQYIQWIPDNQRNLFSPFNIGNVTLKGFEITSLFTYSFRKINISNKTFYAYTLSIPQKGNNFFYAPSAKQLLYTPIYNLKNNLQIQLANFISVNASYQLVSWRAVSTDNYDYLPWYQTINIGIQKQITVQKQIIDVFFNINNLFNERYFVIAGRPLPLRNYNVGFIYVFNKTVS